MSELQKEYFDERMDKLTETIGEMKKDINVFAKSIVQHDQQLKRLDKDIKDLKLRPAAEAV